MDLESIKKYSNGIPVSLNMACKLLRRGKVKVRGMIGTKIRLVEGSEGNSYGLNLMDVLEQVGKR